MALSNTCLTVIIRAGYARRHMIFHIIFGMLQGNNISYNNKNLLQKVFLSDEGPMLETLDDILSVLAVHRPFCISICII